MRTTFSCAFRRVFPSLVISFHNKNAIFKRHLLLVDQEFKSEGKIWKPHIKLILITNQSFIVLQSVTSSTIYLSLPYFQNLPNQNYHYSYHFPIIMTSLRWHLTVHNFTLFHVLFLKDNPVSRVNSEQSKLTKRLESWGCFLMKRYNRLSGFHPTHSGLLDVKSVLL